MEQIAIAILGVWAIFLSQDHRHSRRKWACVFGLLGQPFWFIATVKAEQWGIVVLCGFYTLAWARGVKTNWLDARRG